MFKISEVASKLNVETYVIFEKLLTHAEVLKPYTEKVNSISYVNEIGIEVIQALINGDPIESAIDKFNEDSDGQEILTKELPSEESILEKQDVQDESDVDEDWLTEEDLLIIDNEKIKLRAEVSKLRNQMIQYDSELKRLDDALLNYQLLMREDIDYLMGMEEKLEKQLFSKIIESKEENDQNGGVFGFIKR